MQYKIVALILSAMTSLMPLSVWAQEASDPSVQPQVAAQASESSVATDDSATPAAVSNASSDSATASGDTLTTDASSTSAVITDVQDTTSTQDAATADVLEATADPQATSTTEIATTVQNDATTTDQTSVDVTPDQNDQQQVVAPIDPQPQLDVVAQSLSAEPEATSTAPTFQREVDPDFVIALSGKTIPTERKDAKTGKTLQTINSATNASVDSSTGDVHLSGTCSNTYFVVLLFKNQGDYDTDPRSYILNKAFPCTNGQYSYSISDLPPTLENGTYYLLVGEQGDKGSWKPVTSLTEITINRQ